MLRLALAAKGIPGLLPGLFKVRSRGKELEVAGPGSSPTAFSRRFSGPSNPLPASDAPMDGAFHATSVDLSADRQEFAAVLGVRA